MHSRSLSPCCLQLPPPELPCTSGQYATITDPQRTSIVCPGPVRHRKSHVSQAHVLEIAMATRDQSGSAWPGEAATAAVPHFLLQFEGISWWTNMVKNIGRLSSPPCPVPLPTLSPPLS